MPIWDDILNAADREVIRLGGYGKPRGLGHHPVLVVIDAQYNYCGENRPILQQIAQYPSGAGETAWRAADVIRELLDTVRGLGLPVIFTRQVHRDVAFDGFAAKADRDPTNYLEGAPGTRIIEALAPRPDEIVVDKYYASAFYGSPLLSILMKLRADTLIVAGGTTSGCVRAFCVDAVSRCFNVAVVQDAVFDRISISHKAALLDMWMKYCDLLTGRQARDYFRRIAISGGQSGGVPASVR